METVAPSTAFLPVFQDKFVRITKKIHEILKKEGRNGASRHILKMHLKDAKRLKKALGHHLKGQSKKDDPIIDIYKKENQELKQEIRQLKKAIKELKK